MELESLYRLKNLITELRHELQMQRVKIERLEPKAEAYDALIKVLGMVRGGDRAMARDIMWDIERAEQDLDGAIRAWNEQQEAMAAKRAAEARDAENDEFLAAASKLVPDAEMIVTQPNMKMEMPTPEVPGADGTARRSSPGKRDAWAVAPGSENAV